MLRNKCRDVVVIIYRTPLDYLENYENLSDFKLESILKVDQFMEFIKLKIHHVNELLL